MGLRASTLLYFILLNVFVLKVRPKNIFPHNLPLAKWSLIIKFSQFRKKVWWNRPRRYKQNVLLVSDYFLQELFKTGRPVAQLTSGLSGFHSVLWLTLKQTNNNRFTFLPVTLGVSCTVMLPVAKQVTTHSLK